MFVSGLALHSVPSFSQQPHVLDSEWIGESTIKTMRLANYDVLMNLLAFDRIRGDVTERQFHHQEVSFNTWSMQMRPRPGSGLVEQSWLGAAAALPGMIGGVVDGIEGGGAAGIGCASLATIGGQLGPQVALIEELITAPSAFLWCFSPGYAFYSSWFWYRQAVGLMYRSLRNIEVEAFQTGKIMRAKVSHDTASVLALLFGIPYMLIEKAQVARLGLAAQSIRTLQNDVKHSITCAAVQITQKYLTNVSVQTLQEAVQGAIAEISNQVGIYFSGGHHGLPNSIQRVGLAFFQEGIASIGPMMFLSSAGLAYNVSATWKESGLHLVLQPSRLEFPHFDRYVDLIPSTMVLERVEAEAEFNSSVDPKIRFSMDQDFSPFVHARRLANHPLLRGFEIVDNVLKWAASLRNSSRGKERPLDVPLVQLDGRIKELWTFVEKGLEKNRFRYSGDEIDRKKKTLNEFKVEAEERLNNGTASYMWWVLYNFRMAILLTPEFKYEVPGLFRVYFFEIYTSGAWQSHDQLLTYFQSNKTLMDDFFKSNLYPQHVAMPFTIGKVGEAVFNRLFLSGVHIIGLADTPLHADRVLMEPDEFFIHDWFHMIAETQVLADYDPKLFSFHGRMLQQLFNLVDPNFTQAHQDYFDITHEAPNLFPIFRERNLLGRADSLNSFREAALSQQP